MKTIMRVYRWIIISVFFQVLVLLFFNNVYLTGRGNVIATLLDGEQGLKPVKDVTYKLPKNAASVKVSFDNSYISYIMDNKLEIVDLKSKKNIKTVNAEKDILTYYNWLPDRNMVIYSLRAPDNDAGRVQVITYNVDSDSEHAYPKITGVPKKSEIADIELSPLTNVIYAKVKVSEGQAKIYRYDIMSYLTYIMPVNMKTIVKEMMYKDRLVYQDEKGKVYLWDKQKGTKTPIAFENNVVLLNIAGSDDEVYMGISDKDGKIIEILYGRVDQNPKKQWKRLPMDTPVQPENIIVTNEGTVFYVLDDEKKAYNLIRNSEISYKGTLLDITDDRIITLNNGTLKISAVKE